MAFERMLRETSMKKYDRLQRQEDIQKLIGIRTTLTDILLQDGTESTHRLIDVIFKKEALFTKGTLAQFAGKWQEQDVQVQIFAEASKEELNNNKNVYVDINMGGYTSKYLLDPLEPEDNKKIHVRFTTRRIWDQCLELGQVVEAIHGGQLRIVGQ